eukprot:CAMPEP_0202907750 /NCGR_PEP_ID=MMETSP1392-20130828/43705_1 /ASSEMBLY_ACC=CAM_ASM_000868 /TAXON_ID=225041 /ORGANISM="Chlamydomonas chlamydogama, Strain SAG 11-48b" /LENGTH=224 /DNA_ID=CAMNT_0049596789 /DNA_START=100 /DNA_END=771 /DNA_ORIENTATION=+
MAEGNLGPLWSMYSEVWVGRRLRRNDPESTGTVLFGPFCHPDAEFAQVFLVKWSNERASCYVSVDEVRSHALPEFATELEVVPPAILELQRQGWRDKSMLAKLSGGEGTAKQGSGALNRSSGAPAASTERPSKRSKASQPAKSPHKSRFAAAATSPAGDSDAEDVDLAALVQDVGETARAASRPSSSHHAQQVEDKPVRGGRDRGGKQRQASEPAAAAAGGSKE